MKAEAIQEHEQPQELPQQKSGIHLTEKKKYGKICISRKNEAFL
jgi:hypothetical protein